jgi:hypothetical protein
MSEKLPPDGGASVPEVPPQATGSRLPRRRVLLELKIGADSRERLLDELADIERRLRMETLWGECVMGGWGSGWTLKVDEDPTITHESYFAAINADSANAKLSHSGAEDERKPNV